MESEVFKASPARLELLLRTSEASPPLFFTIIHNAGP